MVCVDKVFSLLFKGGDTVVGLKTLVGLGKLVELIGS